MTSSVGCHATHLTSCVCSMRTPMHSKSASGWARIYVSYIRLHDMMPRTFPHPDGLVATTTGKQIARTGPGNAFAFGLMAFEDANAFPFAGRIFVIFVLSLTLPDTNIGIKGRSSKSRPGRRPCNTAHGFDVSGGDGCMQGKAGRKICCISVKADGLVCGASC